MQNRSEKIALSKTGILAMWAGWLFGPVAWAAHQNVSYGLTHLLCGAGAKWPFYLATFLALAVVAAAGYVSWWLRQATLEARDTGNHAVAASRGRFVATVGVLICALSGTGILVETIPVLMLDACAGAT
ncbi:hypothetical protein [Nitratireductor thuwali]|uniref:Uncharacterized protein n=1 Tax=Nitratireductor thuwali TaxID=2267699 RepID=A0ABY5MM08_9HYPH|nr:hypothetical protein NTH_02595 [Nitratireductor thuwali]